MAVLLKKTDKVYIFPTESLKQKENIETGNVIENVKPKNGTSFTDKEVFELLKDEENPDYKKVGCAILLQPERFYDKEHNHLVFLKYESNEVSHFAPCTTVDTITNYTHVNKYDDLQQNSFITCLMNKFYHPHGKDFCNEEKMTEFYFNDPLFGDIDKKWQKEIPNDNMNKEVFAQHYKLSGKVLLCTEEEYNKNFIRTSDNFRELAEKEREFGRKRDELIRTSQHLRVLFSSKETKFV